MKKAHIINLIKYHLEENPTGFRDASYVIANEFEKVGDYEIAQYIYHLLENLTNEQFSTNTEIEYQYLKKVDLSDFKYENLSLPRSIKEDIIGIVHATKNYTDVNKFLFQGSPGTGKTECAKLLASVLERKLYIVDFNTLISSELGSTSKNIAALFSEINDSMYAEQVVILFDEIDALALERTSNRDLREMGRATTAVLKGLDELAKDAILVATTNLFEFFDKALVRRFDAVINFDRYTKEDLIKLAEVSLNKYLSKAKHLKRNLRLFKKILKQANHIPYPGDLNNLIKKAITFCNSEYEYDYLKRIYIAINELDDAKIDPVLLEKQGFTPQEIDILTHENNDKVLKFGVNY